MATMMYLVIFEIVAHAIGPNKIKQDKTVRMIQDFKTR